MGNTDNEPQRILLIGGSAGSTTGLKNLLLELKPEKVCVLVTVHVVHTPYAMANYLDEKSELNCRIAKGGEALQAGTIFIAPADKHLMLGDEKQIILGLGPRENSFRPAIDVLFRSAAVQFGNRTIGVLLSGRLSDGTAGMEAVKSCGGITIVEDPTTAEYGEMPDYAIQEMSPDYVESIENIPDLLEELINSEHPPAKEISKNLKLEARLGCRVASQIGIEETLGDKVALSCPDCGGPLWKMKEGSSERYRCHVGHGFTDISLAAGQHQALEKTLWVALRTFEEKIIHSKKMVKSLENSGMTKLAQRREKRIKEMQEHVELLRKIMGVNSDSADNLLSDYS